MPARNELDRLAAAGRPLHAEADALLGAGEEDAILEQIVGTDRPARRFARRRPLQLALAGVVVLACVAAVTALEAGNGNKPSAGPAAQRHATTLSGAKIQMAGYHFRTPAGFKSSDASCEGATPTSPGSPETPLHAMRSAASADGGCIEVFYLIAGSPTASTPSPTGQPVDVGPFQGYYDSPGESDATLYVELPQASGAPVFLVLFAEGLTEDQMIEVAASGLPASR